MKRIVLPALLLLIPAAGSAADPTPAAGEVTAKAKPRKICHEEIRTGTRFSTQICKTKEEWDAEAEKARETVDDWSRKSSGRFSGGPDGGGGVRSGVGIGGM